MGQTSSGFYDGVLVTGIPPGAGADRILKIAGVPGAGTDETQTLTIGGTPTGGTFKLGFESEVTAAITWSATTSTLLSNINAALLALTTIGAGDLIATDVDLVGGIGDVLLTFGALRAKQAVDTVTVADNSLTGTAPTLAIVQTQAGVDSAFRGWPVGQLVMDTTNKILYVNTGTSVAPTWTKVGAQT
jgi:hypothetical protein